MHFFLFFGFLRAAYALISCPQTLACIDVLPRTPPSGAGSNDSRSCRLTLAASTGRQPPTLTGSHRPPLSVSLPSWRSSPSPSPSPSPS
ncbi:unnamed protein product, partial [Protopolystoma xenopodis]